MTTKQINQHNKEAQNNLSIMRALWNELNRKPTVAEIETAIKIAAGK